MFLRLEFNKVFLGHRNWIWFMLNPVCYMRSFLMLRVLVLTPRPNLDHMPMALLVVRVPNLWIQLWNRWVNYLSTNMPRNKPRLRLNPTKWWMCFWCNRRTWRVTNNPEGIRRRVKTIVKVGIGMKMTTLTTRKPKMLGGTSSLNVRLSFVRIINP